MRCYFNGCLNAAAPASAKCAFHRHRRQCHEAGCRNQVFARNRCVRHGGKRTCVHPGCTANARRNNVCSRHGVRPDKRECSVPACANLAHRFQRCISHGGRRDCRITGCTTHARSGGFCWKHRHSNQFPSSPTASTGSDTESSWWSDAKSSDWSDAKSSDWSDAKSSAWSDAKSSAWSDTTDDVDVAALDAAILASCLTLSTETQRHCAGL
ncbi:hypothetical protein ACHHYP_05298 [Achlya hypogyna]|uniref:Uncharacterized protein n=1 Tax=Achlya hypogyna TaxID=1202772 RepID=A0A1V9YYV3_ACHHY|nr:hypothetical protein ACHHYP_05298 [Achlya hypogyna]